MRRNRLNCGCRGLYDAGSNHSGDHVRRRGNTAVAGLAREHAETVCSPVGRGSTFQQVLARISDSDLFARPIVITIVRTSVLLWRSNYASAVSKPTSCSNRCACLSLCCGRNQERIYKGLTALRSRIRAKWVCWVKKSSLLEPIDLSLFI